MQQAYAHTSYVPSAIPTHLLVDQLFDPIGGGEHDHYWKFDAGEQAWTSLRAVERNGAEAPASAPSLSSLPQPEQGAEPRPFLYRGRLFAWTSPPAWRLVEVEPGLTA